MDQKDDLISIPSWAASIEDVIYVEVEAHERGISASKLLREILCVYLSKHNMDCDPTIKDK